MNQSKQKSDALADAVREYLNLPFGDNPSEAKLKAVLADYEAIGPDEPVQRPALSPIEELDRADFSAWRHWFEDNGEPAGLSTAMIWDKALRYAIAKYGTQHAPTEPALPACEWCNGAGVLRSLGRDNDEVIEDCPKCTQASAAEKPDWHIVVSEIRAMHSEVEFELSEKEAVALCQREAKPATGEQPGADWMRDLANAIKVFIDLVGGENVNDADIIALLKVHAPATPALAEVSARELIAELSRYHRQLFGNSPVAQSKASDAAQQGHASVLRIEAERAAKAKEPHAFASLENLATEKPHP